MNIKKSVNGKRLENQVCLRGQKQKQMVDSQFFLLLIYIYFFFFIVVQFYNIFSRHISFLLDQKNKSKKPMEKKKKEQQQRNNNNNKKKVVAGEHKMHKSKAKKVATDPAKKSGSSKRKRTAANDIYDDVESKFTVMERAERVLESVADETPCFLKCMLPSNVTYSFWLIIPKRFCSLHLPSEDSSIILVDEWGKEYKTNYLIDRHGLSAGWRGFSISHRLLKGDILIFRLIAPCKLKVHIVRVHSLDVVNAALCLMNMDAFGKASNSELAKQEHTKRKRKKKYEEPILLDAPKFLDTVRVNDQLDSKHNILTIVDQSKSSIDSFGSQVAEGFEILHHLIPADQRCFESSILHDHPCKGVTCR